QLPWAADRPVLRPLRANEEGVLGVVADALVVVAELDADDGVGLDHCAVRPVHPRLLMRVEADAVADELAREVRQVPADRGVAPPEYLAAGDAGTDPGAQLHLHLVEALPDLAVARTRLADEVGAHEIGGIAAVLRSHVDLDEVAA